MKKLAFALSALAALTAGSAMAQDTAAQGAANTADGTVEIRGRVVDQTCEVNTNYKNLVVVLDTIGKAKLNGEIGKASSPKPFTIALEGCAAPTTDLTTVYASFSSASVADTYNQGDSDFDAKIKGVLRNKTTDNAATGVGIQLLNADGTAVDLSPLDNSRGDLGGSNNGAVYAATDNEVVFGVVKNYGTDKFATRTAATAAGDNVLGKKVAGGETWVGEHANTNNKGAALAQGAVALNYQAQYISTAAEVTAGDVEAFVSYNISYK